MERSAPANGIAAPYGVKLWCLGNEMDGNWQIGHMTADEYGLKAADAARQMRAVDPSLLLIACGSSGPAMPTYLEWDRQVLEQCYDDVDASLVHRYFDNDRDTGGRQREVPGAESQHGTADPETIAVCDYVRARKARRRPVALLRRVERLVPRADIDGHRKRLRTCSRRSTTSKTRCWLAA